MSLFPNIKARIIQCVTLSAALLYCTGAIVLVSTQPALTCRWSAARTSIAIARRREAADDEQAGMHAYFGAARWASGCRTAAAAMFSADALVHAGAAYGRSDYIAAREIAKSERTTLLAHATAVGQIAHIVADNIDFTHRTFMAINRALESVNRVSVVLGPTAWAGDSPGHLADDSLRRRSD